MRFYRKCDSIENAILSKMRCSKSRILSCFATASAKPRRSRCSERRCTLFFSLSWLLTAWQRSIFCPLWSFPEGSLAPQESGPSEPGGIPRGGARDRQAAWEARLMRGGSFAIQGGWPSSEPFPWVQAPLEKGCESPSVRGARRSFLVLRRPIRFP